MATFISFLIVAQPAMGQTLTPQDARATLTVARAQATAVSDLATANAPTKTPEPTITPVPPTSTPAPTATATPTSTPVPTVTSTASPTETPMAISTPAATTSRRTFADDLPIVIVLCLLAASVLIGVYWLTARTRERIEPND